MDINLYWGLLFWIPCKLYFNWHTAGLHKKGSTYQTKWSQIQPISSACTYTIIPILLLIKYMPPHHVIEKKKKKKKKNFDTTFLTIRG